MLCLLMVAGASMAQAQTVDEIIAKNIEAMGGKEKLASLNSVKISGTLNVQGFDVELTTTILNQKGSRNDINVPGMGEGYIILTPTKGWNYLPFQGMTAPEELTEDQVKTRASQLDIQGPLFNYKEKGNQVELVSTDQNGENKLYKLKVTYKNGKVSYFFIDSKTFYRVKTVTTVEANGESVEIETTYSDFRKTREGYVFAYSNTSQQGTTTVTAIEVNKPVDENIFTVK